MARLWSFIKENYDALLSILLSFAIAILKLLGLVSNDTVYGAILAVLSLTALGLLRNRSHMAQLQKTMGEALEHVSKPSASQVFEPFEDCAKQIEKRMVLAKEVWVLSRTCTHIWQDYNDEFTNLLQAKGMVKLMLVHPENGSVKMIARTAEWDRANSADLLQETIKGFLKHLAEKQGQFKRGNLQVHVIDYLPAWTLFFIDPQTDHGVVYIELATFRANGRTRPTFALTPTRDGQLFQQFRTEYERMWQYAQSIETLACIKEPTL